MYIGQTSKKVSTRHTEHQNAIQCHDHLSLPASHADDNGHKFDFENIKLLGKAQMKEARELIETWHSLDKSSFNHHIEIPSVYLQLESKPNNQSKQTTDQTTKVMNRNITPSTSPRNPSNTAGRINNYAFHISNATAADLDCIPIEYFVKHAGFGEIGVEKA